VPDDPFGSLLPALRDLSDWFRSANTPYLIIGGVAVSLVGRARITQDVDLVVLIDDAALGTFIDSGSKFGIIPRVANPIQFAKQSCMLLMVHQADGVRVDIALAGARFEKEAIKHAVPQSARGVDLLVPRVEDLIIMKAVSGRPIDLADIDTLLDMNPKADRRRIRRLARDFATMLELPEIAENVEKLLAAKRVPPLRKKKRRRK